MEFFDEYKYKNWLQDIGLSSLDIEEQIQNYPLSFDSTKDEDAESFHFPVMVDVFYKQICELGRIQTQEEFVNSCLKDSQLKESKLHTKSIVARLKRAYPSLVRDLHFNKKYQETHPQNDVIYNGDLDIRYGIDSMIRSGNCYFGVNLFTDTIRANDYRGRKNNRHQDFFNVNIVDIRLSMDDCLRVGKFFLYPNIKNVDVFKLYDSQTNNRY